VIARQLPRGTLNVQRRTSNAQVAIEVQRAFIDVRAATHAVWEFEFAKLRSSAFSVERSAFRGATRRGQLR